MTAEVIDLDARRECYEAPPSFYSSEHYAEVKPFTPKIARCSICLSPHHRAAQCKMKKTRDTLRLGD